MARDVNLGLIALTRFGYGPRGDGDVAIAASDPRGFLEAELVEPGIALLSGPMLPTTRTAIQQFFADQQRRKMERAAQAQTLAAGGKPAGDAPPAGPAAQPAVAAAMRPQAMPSSAMQPTAMQAMAAPAPTAAEPPKPPPRPPSPEQIIFRAEALARMRRAIEARAGLAERLVAFWSNHFCVSAGKGGIARVTCGAFEREAIRPHVLGKFSDMLLAVESHPAMLHFLDNAPSIGPNSRIGLRGKRGLNENLGREILELHTMGVGSGYTQADVTNLAKILTGWTYVGPQARLGEPGDFVFNPDAHEPGAISVLGRSYDESGIEQGRAALVEIARRPETARFIARKFAAAFVADDPPASLVQRLAGVFAGTDGDLRALTFALLDAPEAWDGPAKVRSPYEFLIGCHRLLGTLPDDPGVINGPLNAMGMALWSPPGPNGYPTSVAAWASPEGMKVRLDYCAQIAARMKEPPNPSELLDALAGGAPSPQSREAVARAESRSQGLALLLMTPEMQRS